jgi:hypothetical protein
MYSNGKLLGHNKTSRETGLDLISLPVRSGETSYSDRTVAICSKNLCLPPTYKCLCVKNWGRLIEITEKFIGRSAAPL